tara:strand:- start:741 stop:3155 length:2415 start_codon:yes stop_codon:yes gene_type:complete
MAKTLVIVESPAKCSKIEKYLGSSLYKCVASYGHIREMDTKKGLSCIDFDTFNVTYKNVFRQSKNISRLRDEINKSKEVIIATDDDREGEAIGWHICNAFKLSIEKTKRIIFHEITKPALEKAIRNPIKVNMDMVYSQQSRQIIDLIVGFNMSPLLWKYVYSGKPSLSAGRCQTPALRLIYDNHMEIKDNPGEFLHSIYGIFSTVKFDLQKQFKEIDEVEKFLEESVVFDHKITKGKNMKLNKKPPTPLTTSIIQQKASSKFNYSPKVTMSICQNLYEAGYITYMRTDSKKYSSEFIDNAKKLIETKYGSEYINDKLCDDLRNNAEIEEKPLSKNKDKSKKKGKKDDLSQEAHEAIRPTNINVAEIEINWKITHKEKRIYEFIRNTTIESCMMDAIYKRFASYITAPFDNKYSASFQKKEFDGWHIVENIDDTTAEYREFKSFDNDSLINYDKIYSKYTLLHKKQHINEAKLVKLLEDKGIGRPSTFSSLVSKIQERGYVVNQDVVGKKVDYIELSLENDEIEEISGEKNIGCEKNKLVITPIGITVIEFLISNCDNIFNYDYTRNMEIKLDDVAKHKLTKFNVCNDVNDNIHNILDNINVEEISSHKIDDENTLKIGRYGPMIESRENGEKIVYKLPNDIDIHSIKNGKCDISEIKKESKDKKKQMVNKSIGKYKNKEVILKNGKYGFYVTYDKKNISVKFDNDDINIEKITIDDVKDYIEYKINPNLKERNSQNMLLKNKNVIRIINSVSQLRNGKFGHYIYYKTEDMTKPLFMNIKKPKNDIDFEKDDIDIIKEWIQKQLN